MSHHLRKAYYAITHTATKPPFLSASVTAQYRHLQSCGPLPTEHPASIRRRCSSSSSVSTRSHSCTGMLAFSIWLAIRQLELPPHTAHLFTPPVAPFRTLDTQFDSSSILVNFLQCDVLLSVLTSMFCVRPTQMAIHGRTSWLYDEGYETWPTWERYVRAFDRALLISLADGNHGSTPEEIALSALGLLCGVVALAYFTSTMVTLVTSLSQETKPFVNSLHHVRTRTSIF